MGPPSSQVQALAGDISIDYFLCGFLSFFFFCPDFVHLIRKFYKTNLISDGVEIGESNFDKLNAS